MAAPRAESTRTIAISISESPDMAALGLGESHLRDALAELATYLLASGACLAYGGDLRRQGFTDLLFELVMRYTGQGENGVRVTDYLAWPVHVGMSGDELRALSARVSGFASLALMDPEGRRMSMEGRLQLPSRRPEEDEWASGLTSMRHAMREDTDVRIALGGRIEGYRGDMPGIAEEALLSLKAGQPLFLVGGFGGCARDIAETMGLAEAWSNDRADWRGRQLFECCGPESLRNGLTLDENRLLARSQHLDQIVSLVLRGIRRTTDGAAPDR